MSGTTLTGYTKYDDVADLTTGTSAIFEAKPITDSNLKDLGINKKAEDVAELYVPTATAGDYTLINTSGKVIDNKGKSKDGNDYYYVVNNKKVVAIYLEN